MADSTAGDRLGNASLLAASGCMLVSTFAPDVLPESLKGAGFVGGLLLLVYASWQYLHSKLFTAVALFGAVGVLYSWADNHEGLARWRFTHRLEKAVEECRPLVPSFPRLQRAPESFIFFWLSNLERMRSDRMQHDFWTLLAVTPRLRNEPDGEARVAEAMFTLSCLSKTGQLTTVEMPGTKGTSGITNEANQSISYTEKWGALLGNFEINR